MVDPLRVVDKLAWIELVDGHILSTRSRGKDTYYIPGGKRENGESDSDALIREIHEELSVHLLPETVEYAGTFRAQAHGHVEGVLVQMTCYFAAYAGELKPAAEIEEVAWLTYRDRTRSSPVDQIIFEWLYNQGRLVP